MRKLYIVNIFIAIALLLTLLACAAPPPPPRPTTNSAANSRQAAENAMAEMEGRPAQNFTQQNTQQNTQQSTAQQGFSSLDRPIWVDNPQGMFPPSQFVSAVGNGISRDMAEKNALASLTAFFGQSILADQTVSYAYNEAFKSGATADWIENTAILSNVRTSATMETLIGAEIREVWHDSRANTYFAVALMDRARTIQTYSELIVANQNMINNLINMPQAEKNTLAGYSRYLFAAVTADMNVTYGNLLNVIGATSPVNLTGGNTYRLEAQNIATALPIGVRVNNDKANRMKGAFDKAVTDLGFRTGNNASQYVIEVDITVSPVELANQQNKFVRIELSAVLMDTATGTGLLPWNFADRQGHTSVSEAENRAYTAAERKINAEYKDHLYTYLAQLLPRR